MSLSHRARSMNGRQGVTAFVSFSLVLSAMAIPSFFNVVVCRPYASAITVPAGRLEISRFPKVNFSMLKKNPAAFLNCAITEDLSSETVDITPDSAVVSSMLGGTYLAVDIQLDLWEGNN